MKVLFVTPRYLPYIGGTEMHVHEVGQRLVKLGHQVTILTTATNPDYTHLPQQETIEGMQVIRVQAWPDGKDYYIAPAIAKFIQADGWDLVHCQGCHTFVPLIAMRAAKKARIPYLATFHTGGHSAGWRNKIRAVQWQILRPYLAHARKLVGVSHFEASYFQHFLKLPQERFAVIPNGVNIPARADIQPPSINHTQIVSLGRLERYKGHHLLIAALPDILKQRSDVRLLILGSGPYEAELQQLAQAHGVAEHVEIRSIPASKRQEMMGTLAQSALVALLSEYESQGIAALEALALRRPLLVSNTSALKELSDKGWARAIELESTPQQIAQAVLQQLTDPLIAQNIEIPTWEQCAQQLSDVYMGIHASR